MSWAQEGRERKQKELAKSEVYAETGITAAKKRPRKSIIVEWRYSEEGWLNIQQTSPWTLRWRKDNRWIVYHKYARESDAIKAIEALTSRSGPLRQYRIKD